jgi:hypothetical protein
MKCRRNSESWSARAFPVTSRGFVCSGRFRSSRTKVVIGPRAEPQFGIEHSKIKGVELMIMHRAKLILSLLIPALWLAGSLGSFSNQVLFSAAGDPGTFLCAAGHKHDLSTSVGSFDQAIRRAVRRATIQPGLDRMLTPVVIAQAGVHSTDLSFSSPVCSPAALGLAQSWQFRFRAALQPRAPSRLS